jgi:biopolymer transport protein ExbB
MTDASILKFINDSGVVGWVIMLVGVGTLGLIIERGRVLYFRFSLKVDEFMRKIQNLVIAKKYEEALALCGQLRGKPMAEAFRTIIEKADRDDDAIFQAHDIAMAENVPLLTRRTHYLSMLANVATLLGLLGTIHGLIVSFAAVAQADPAAKQAMLATGISVSMYTTALGLVVAIPAMVAYSILVSRQNQLVEQLTEKCGKLTELLTGSHVPSFDRANLYPDNLGNQDLIQKVAPPPAVKTG